MFNIGIRDLMKKKRVYGYEIANKLGISETSFSRKLARRELGEDETKQIIQIITELAEGGK